MTRNRTITAILSLIALFALASQSIVTVKMLELRTQLAKDQLLNYELSSRMLRAKFYHQLLQKDDYSTEIKMNVLESSVMNFDAMNRQMKMNPMEIAGLWIVNGVRLLSFKTFLKLQEDQDKLLLLQYGFYMERTRRYDKAVEKYTILKSRGGLAADDYGFLLLHLGYCLALTGKQDDALEDLREVERTYPGTHYAENASLLIAILLDSKKRTDEIEASVQNEGDRGVAYYNAGLYSEAIEKLSAQQNLSDEQQYALARAYEETGQMNRAMSIYQNLTSTLANSAAAIRANRRLLMIGSFYGGGAEVTREAEKKAETLGDTQVVREVQQGVAVQLKPIVVEVIQQGNISRELDANTVAELKALRNDVEQTLTVEERQVVVRTEEPQTKKEEEKKEPPSVVVERVIPPFVPEKPAVDVSKLRLDLFFIDGRRIQGRTLENDGHQLLVSSGQYHTSVPFSMVDKILPTQGGSILLQMKDGTRKKCSSIRRHENDFLIVEDSGQSTIPGDTVRLISTDAP